MKAPLLTIGIPTWNRAAYLLKAIGSVTSQMPTDGSVEIVVSDNASDDDTPRVFEMLEKRAGLRLFRNARNIGGDYNLCAIAREARGEYIWFLGDDDAITPGSLAVALQAIEQSRAVFLHFGDARRGGPSGRAHGTGLDMANRYGWLDLMGFISTCCVRRQAFLGAAAGERWDRHCRTVFPHALVLLEICARREIEVLGLHMVATQDEKQTPETLKRWAENGTGLRYPWAAENLMELHEAGELPKVEKVFFRYLSTYLWTKILADVINRAGRGHREAGATWDNLVRMAMLLRDDEEGLALEEAIHGVRQGIASLIAAHDRADRAAKQVSEAYAPLAGAAFEYSLMGGALAQVASKAVA